MPLAQRNWHPQRVFLIALTLTLAFRFWLAAVFPITGDEAYFIWWGEVPDWGFYDHPPMIGWWLALLLKVSSAEWWLRLPIVLQPALLAFAMAAFLRQRGDEVAWGAATLMLLAPVNIWNVFITTDTPLIYFSVLSGLAWMRAHRADADMRSPWPWYALAGLGLAGAVLSKYFAVLLGFAFLVDALVKPTRRKFAGLLLVYALVLPGLALMAWWNAGHCWSNVMFNFYNRHHSGNTGLSWKTPLLYFVMMAYLLTPACLWHLQRNGSMLRSLLAQAETRALLAIGFVPLLVFVPLSFVRGIGLHWVLSFVPFVLVALARVVDTDRLRKTVLFFAGFAALHALAAVVIANVPLERWQKRSFYDGLVLTFESQKLLDHLEPYAHYTWMMDGYSNAVTLSYNTYVRDTDGRPRYIGVFGPASSHARHDDILTDLRALDGGDIAILRKSEPQAEEYAPYFTSVEYKRFTVRGATFYLVLGRSFDYVAYRDGILSKIKQDFYRIPAALPQTACYFCDRYFPGQPCRR